MTAATFSEATGELYWRSIWRSRNDMEKQALFFDAEAEKRDYFAKTAKLLAAECWAAIEAYDAFHFGDDDAELQYLTETRLTL